MEPNCLYLFIIPIGDAPTVEPSEEYRRWSDL